MGNTDNFQTSAVLGDAADATQSLFPSTPEEYGVWAVRLQREPRFRDAFVVRDRRALVELVKASRTGEGGHGEQVLKFIRTLLL
mmetsp:Transcript_23213/g.46659  ORF Transcript_23213/g.46659 Transcript_23213/m.46659 type:complete len:84 (+) Transcript_23213:3-254(+)